MVQQRPTASEGFRSFGKAIRAQRELMGISQEKLAEMCELNRGHFGEIERGKVNVSLEVIMKIAYELGLKPSWLFDKADL